MSITEYENVVELASTYRPKYIRVHRDRMTMIQSIKAEAILSRAGYRLKLAAGREWVYERVGKK